MKNILPDPVEDHEMIVLPMEYTGVFQGSAQFLYIEPDGKCAIARSLTCISQALYAHTFPALPCQISPMFNRKIQSMISPDHSKAGGPAVHAVSLQEEREFFHYWYME